MWQIIEQMETVGRSKFPTKVKNVRFFPIEKGGFVEGFGKLKNILLQVIVSNGKTELKLKLHSDGSINPSFTVQHPETMQHPTIAVGEGRNRRIIVDVLSPKQKVAGEKEKYNAKGFEARITNIIGKELADEVMGLMARKFANVLEKRAAA